MALVVFSRVPRFVSAPAGCDRVCVWDPYALLCVPPETLDDLLALAKSIRLHSSSAEAAVRKRASGIRAAYVELAARYHPDVSEAPGAHTPVRWSSWISVYDHFAAIASAYKTLADLSSTLEYHAAGLSSMASFDDSLAQVSGKPAHSRAASARTLSLVAGVHVQPHAAIIRELRYQRAQAERAAMQSHIAVVLEEQKKRVAEAGDGLLVKLGLYGDSRILHSLLPLIRGGQGFNPSTDLITDRVIDVTMVVQGLVEITERDAHSESKVVQLVLPAGSKVELEGFWDPADGEAKELFLRYEFLGRLHEVTLEDEAPLKAPLKRASCSARSRAQNGHCTLSLRAHAGHVISSKLPSTPPRSDSSVAQATATKAPRQVGASFQSLRTVERGKHPSSRRPLHDGTNIMGAAPDGSCSPQHAATRRVASPLKSIRKHARRLTSSQNSSDAENADFSSPLSASFVTCCSDTEHVEGRKADSASSSPSATNSEADTEVVTFTKTVDADTGAVTISRSTQPMERRRDYANAMVSHATARRLWPRAAAHRHIGVAGSGSQSPSAPTAASKDDMTDLLRTLRAKAASKTVKDNRSPRWVNYFSDSFGGVPSWWLPAGLSIAAAGLLLMFMWRRNGARSR